MTGRQQEKREGLGAVFSSTAGVALAIFVAFVALDVWTIHASLPKQLFGDEWRYLYYAQNLLSGYFSPPERVFLWNGPGYPLLIAPFVAAGWTDGARYVNAPLHAGALVYAWLVLRPRMPKWWALGVTLGLGLYPPAREHLPLVYTEIFSFFLVPAWMFHALRGRTCRVHAGVAGVALALLCLTKVVFGPVLTVFVVVVLVWRRFRPSRASSRHLAAGALALALCSPFLVYTYRLTGKAFYWSSAWPNSFYWLTSPHPGEVGDWYHPGWVFKDPLLRAHHGELFLRTSGLAENPRLPTHEQILNLSSPESADVFLAAGLENAREHPLSFVRNWCLNWSRLFFDVPVSVRGTPFWNSATRANLPLLLGAALLAFFGFRLRVRPAKGWGLIALFGVLALGVYGFSSMMARFLVPLVPLGVLFGASYGSRVFARCRTSQRRQSALARAASSAK